MMDHIREYKQKLRTPDEAVSVIKSGDWVEYMTANGFPYLLDKALAKRKYELSNVKIRGNLIFGPIEAVECDPEREHFIYNSWHCSAYERKLCDRGLCNFIPMIFRNVVEYYRHFLDVNVAMMCVTPMDRHGYFNFSTSIGIARGILEDADVVILEVNENLPKIYGGREDSIHISEVDMVVEGEHPPLVSVPDEKATEEELEIARHIVPFIGNGSVLQLGIGGTPGVIGNMIAESDLKDLGMHTELASDAFYHIYRAGKLSNRTNTPNPGKGTFGIGFGSEEFYDWINENPGVIGYPLAYVNNPAVIGGIDNMISVNSCISVDLYGQVSAESFGTRQISGTGGQLDFLTGAADSKNGKAFICLPSIFRMNDGEAESNIKPLFNGDIVTSPRSQMYYVVTEYGAVNLVGCSTWERAEKLISIAHPDFRDELIEAAEKQKIWIKSNKR